MSGSLRLLTIPSPLVSRPLRLLCLTGRWFVVATMLMGSVYEQSCFAQIVRNANRPERVDLYGDPLPTGAVGRMGTSRFRLGTRVGSVAFSPDGRSLAVPSQSSGVPIWDTATGRLIMTLPPRKGVEPEDGSIGQVVFSPDGRMLAGFYGHDVTGIWATSSGKEIRIFPGNEEALFGVGFTPDGDRVFSYSDARVRLWNLASGAEIRQFRAPGHQIWSTAISPDSRILATASWGGDIRLWDVATRARRFGDFLDTDQSTWASRRTGKRFDRLVMMAYSDSTRSPPATRSDEPLFRRAVIA